MLNNVLSTYKTAAFACRYEKSPYICIVFFIVLDLRLTKGWVKALTLFYARTVFVLFKFNRHLFSCYLSQ